MKKTLSFVALAVIATALLSPGTAKAQAFGGTFRGPHGSFSIGVGDPFVPEVDAYVPDPYVEDVYYEPDYGYGFYYDSQWVPCRQYGSRWIIVGAPIAYGYGRPSRFYGRESFRGRGSLWGRESFRGRDSFRGRESFRRDFDRRFDGRRDRRDGRWDGRR
ncbi:MAG TPA: hypothetical protein VER78_03125 [Thermoanaerobaculia bacterium]|nr:hypothetical protein [Thermoanaerobaculia bacterium]